MTDAPASSPPQVRVLGPITAAGSEIAGLLPRRLVAALALAAPHALGVDALTDRLWGDDEPANPRAALQTLVSRTRAVLPHGAIESTAAGYRLVPATDLGVAERAAETDDEAAVASARSLWRGDPGADLGDAPVAADLAQASASLRRRLERRHAVLLLEQGRGDEAADTARLLVLVDPLDEDAVVLLMSALEASGRLTEALGAFAAHRAALRDALGAVPGPAAVELNARLLSAEAERSRVRVGVRAASGPLIGREEEIAEVERLTAEHRLATILGVGGLGKTALAQEVARRSAAPGVVVVELAGTVDADDVMLTVATTLGIRSATTASRLQDPTLRTDLATRVVQALGERETLFVLDNCEHLVDAAAALVADLLASVPELRVLATSRAPLALPGEQVMILRPLPSRDAGRPGPAVALFAERARAVRPGAEIPVDSVERICTRLDGLPLAIELAAARVRSLSVEDIERRLNDRFALLTTVDRAAPARHRTLFAVIDWSWQLLEPAQRSLLERLTVFADGFSAEAASAVSGRDVTDDLDALVMQSLVLVTETAGTVRYRMLETVREFGRERLLARGALEETEDVVSRWAAEFARTRSAALMGPQQVEALSALETEHDNLVAVLRRALARQDADVAHSIFGTMAVYWTIRGEHDDVSSFGSEVERATRHGEVSAEVADVAATGLSVIAVMETVMGRARIGAHAASRARRLLRTGRATAPLPRAIVRLVESVVEGAGLRAGVERELSRMLEDPDGFTALLAGAIAASLAENDGEVDTARSIGTVSYTRARSLRNTWGASLAAMSLTQLASQNDDPETAVAWAGTALELLSELGAHDDVSNVDWMLASNLVKLGRIDDARRVLAATDGADERHAAELVPIRFAVRGDIAWAEGRWDDAIASYTDSAEALREARLGASPWALIALSTAVSARLLSGAEPSDVERDALRVRSGLIVGLAERPFGTDQPVSGAAMVGVAAWSLAIPELSDLGIELLATAEAMTSRQDFAPLVRTQHIERAERIAGADAVASARSRLVGMDAEARVAHARSLLRDPRWGAYRRRPGGPWDASPAAVV